MLAVDKRPAKILANTCSKAVRSKRSSPGYFAEGLQPLSKL